MNLTKEAFFGMYIGQKVKFELNGQTLTCHLTEVGREHIHCNRLGDGIKITDTLKAFAFRISIDTCKLILRTFEDMTEKEVTHLRKLQNNAYREIQISGSILSLFEEQFATTQYLISIGIDVFGLIERGWAIRESEEEK